MRNYRKSTNSYTTKIRVFFKHFLAINLLFISFAYPLSNTNDNQSHLIFVDDKDNESYVMQKAFEAEILAQNRDYQEASKIG